VCVERERERDDNVEFTSNHVIFTERIEENNMKNSSSSPSNDLSNAVASFRHYRHQNFILSVIGQLSSVKMTATSPWRLLRVVAEAFNVRQYDDLIEERVRLFHLFITYSPTYSLKNICQADCVGLCGFAACRNRVQQGKRCRKLSRKSDRYLESQDERRYCSKTCFRVSTQFRERCVLDEASFTRSNFEIEHQRQKYRAFIKIIKEAYKNQRTSWYEYENPEVLRKEWDSIMDRLIWNTFQLPRYNHQEAIEFVRHRRRYINFQRPCDGTTLLQGACFRGVVSVVNILLEMGADKNIRNKFGHNAIDIARNQKHKNILDILSPSAPTTLKSKENVIRNLKGRDIQLNDMVKRMGDSFRIVERGVPASSTTSTTSTLNESTKEDENNNNVFKTFIRPRRRRVRCPRPSDLGPLNRISVALGNWFTSSTRDMLRGGHSSSSSNNVDISEETRQRLSFVHSQCARSVEYVFRFLKVDKTNLKTIQKRLEDVVDTFDVTRAPVDILPTYQWNILVLYLLIRFRIATVRDENDIDFQELISRVSSTNPWIFLDSVLNLSKLD